MTTLDFVIDDAMLMNEEMKIVESQVHTLKVRSLSNEETAIFIESLSKFAYSPIGFYPKDEVIKHRKKQQIAKELFEEITNYINLGMLRLDMNKESVLNL